MRRTSIKKQREAIAFILTVSLLLVKPSYNSSFLSFFWWVWGFKEHLTLQIKYRAYYAPKSFDRIKLYSPRQDFNIKDSNHVLRPRSKIMPDHTKRQLQINRFSWYFIHTFQCSLVLTYCDWHIITSCYISLIFHETLQDCSVFCLFLLNLGATLQVCSSFEGDCGSNQSNELHIGSLLYFKHVFAC